MRRVWSRLRAMLRRVLDGGARDEELSEEIRAFVEHDAESKIRSGMTPEDARRAALIELGGAEQVKERVREARAGARWESIFRDIRYAIRSLGQARGFSSSVIGSLSLGLAATIVAFAFINGALLRPFPGVRDQDRLVTLGILERTPFGSRLPLTALADYPDVFRALREGMTSLDDLASFTESDVAVTLPQPRSLPAAFVSPNYFDVLGVQPEIGRTFAPEGGRAESAVAIIGHALWTQRVRTRSVSGRPAHPGGRAEFPDRRRRAAGISGHDPEPECRRASSSGCRSALAGRVGDPLSFGRGDIVFLDDQPGERLIRYVGRMRDGVRADRVETELAVIARRVGHARGRPRRRRSWPRCPVCRDSTTGPMPDRSSPSSCPFLFSFSRSPVSTPRTSSWCVPHGAAGRWRSVWRSARPGSGSSGNWSSRASSWPSAPRSSRCRWRGGACSGSRRS